jgi:hypothetical protein
MPDGGSLATCKPGDGMEAEPNDTLATATKVPGTSFCGELSSQTDVDFVEVILPVDAMGFNVGSNQSGGAVKAFVTVEGMRIELGQGTSLPFAEGKPYTFEVQNLSAKKVQYRFEMTVTK